MYWQKYSIMFNIHSYWMQRNTSTLPRIGVISGTPLDGDIFVQITSMNFGYMVNIRLVFPLNYFFTPNRWYGTLASRIVGLVDV